LINEEERKKERKLNDEDRLERNSNLSGKKKVKMN